jgi:hypothetical protein
MTITAAIAALQELAERIGPDALIGTEEIEEPGEYVIDGFEASSYDDRDGEHDFVLARLALWE